MRAIGAFFFVMPGCLVTPYGRPCVTVRVGPSQPLQSASQRWRKTHQLYNRLCNGQKLAIGGLSWLAPTAAHSLQTILYSCRARTTRRPLCRPAYASLEEAKQARSKNGNTIYDSPGPYSSPLLQRMNPP